MNKDRLTSFIAAAGAVGIGVAVVVVWLQFMGLALLPHAVFLGAAVLVGLVFVGCLVAFPLETKVLLAVVVGGLLALSWAVRERTLKYRAQPRISAETLMVDISSSELWARWSRGSKAGIVLLCSAG